MSYLTNPFLLRPPPSAGVTVFDFTGGTMPAGTTLTRSTNGTRFNASGVLETIGPNLPRFDHALTGQFLGLLVEPTRTNLIRNAAATGGATLPGNWGHGPGNGSPTYSRVASSKFTGCQEFSASWFNTSPSNDTSPEIRFDSSTACACTPSDELALSVYYKEHPTPTFQSGVVGVEHNWYNAANALLAAAESNQPNPAANWARAAGVKPAPTDTATCQPRWQIVDLAPQTTSNYTIALPQLEVGGFPTSPIVTTGGQATRQADVLTLTNVTDGLHNVEVTTPNAVYLFTVNVTGGQGWVFAWPPDAVDAGERHIRRIEVSDNAPTPIAPTVGDATFSVSEAAAVDTFVGTVPFSGFPTPSLAITAGNTDSDFRIEANGNIYVNTGATLSNATKPTYNLTVTGTNSAGSDPGTITINVTAAASDAAPTIADATVSFDDDSPAGTLVHTVVDTTGNPDSTFSMTGGEVLSGTTVRVTSGGSIAGTLSNSGQMIVAANPAKNGTVVTGKLVITGNDNIIYGLTWDATAQATAVEIRGKRNKLVNCWFVGHRTGLSWQGCVDIASSAQDSGLEYCSFENIGHVAIRFVAPAPNSRNFARFNHLLDTTGSRDWYVGIQVGQSGDDHGDNASFTLVEGNLLERITAVEAIGIKSSSCTIRGNYLYLGSNINLRQGDDNIVEDNILNGANNACIVICDSGHIVRRNRIWGLGRVAPGEPVIAFSVGSRRTTGTTPTQWYAAKHTRVEDNHVNSSNHAACFGWRNYAPEDFPGDHPIDNQIIGGTANGQTRFDWNNAWSAGEEIPTVTGVVFGPTPTTPDPVPAPPTKPPAPPNRPTVVNTAASGAVAAANSAPANPVQTPVFEIGQTTGEIRKRNVTVDNAANPQFVLTVTATNPVGSDQATITVNLTD